MRLAVGWALVVVACTGEPRTRARASQTTAPRGGVAVAPPRRGTVLVLGTSLTAGLGLEPDQAWPALLQDKIDSAKLPFTVVNGGLSGETSAGALRRVDWLLRGPIDVFVLETGANDGLRGLDADSLQANLEAILGKVRMSRPYARLAVVQMEAPPNLGAAYGARFHAAYGNAARDNGALLLPFLLDSVAGHPELNQADGMHPNVAGSRILARTEWRALRAILGSM